MQDTCTRVWIRASTQVDKEAHRYVCILGKIYIRPNLEFAEQGLNYKGKKRSKLGLG